MREIKFRGYSERDSEWRYGFYVTNGLVHEILTKLENNEMYGSSIDLKSLGQYTGLKDKNGVEIYEGDIVRVGYPYTETNAEVIFNKGQFYPNSKCETIYSRYWDGDCEVIGNIYENEELLK